MRINSVKLENIRSYRAESVSFPEGSTLLIGDIGSGKSSILLAIEFALFGVVRGELNANSLLRHGKGSGSVELNLFINGKSVAIKRTLKRGKSSISQDSGFIIVDGVKSEGTAIELRSRILELMGYPEEFLTKSKSLIFRYTVFTPQEEMKRILFESPEDRINTLRKIFNIDRYKRIKENLQLFLREMRTSKKVLESKTEDIGDLNERKKDFAHRKELLSRELEKQTPLLQELNKELEEKKQLLEKLEKELLENQKIRQNIAIINQNVANKKEIIEKNRQKSIELKSQAEEFEKKSLKKPPEISVEDYRKKLLSSLEENQQKKERAIRQLSTVEAKIMAAKKTIDSITMLDNCPTCLQKVDQSHKHHITTEQNTLIGELEKQKDEQNDLLTAINQKLEKVRAGEQQLSKIEFAKKEHELLQKSIDEKNSQADLLQKESKKLQEEIILLKSKQEDLKKQLKQEDTEKIGTFKSLIDTLRKNQREKELLINSTSKEKEMVVFQEKEVEKLLEQKQEYKAQLEKLSKYQSWLEEYLLNVLDVIEKNVFVSIHRDFDETFRTWFGQIIDEEEISVRLDQTFTPVIEQNGYETFIENLSGGEKTSVALAYRLALNKVINEFITSIKTDELIILDEPTDGFSSEQLDRMRDVLEKLNMKQTIIVSHEPKMESYVENVVRVLKRDHVSRVLT